MFYQHLIIDAVPYIANIMEFSFRMPPHWHNEIEIIYCISGSFKTRINDIEYSVEAGQAVFVKTLIYMNIIRPFRIPKFCYWKSGLYL